MILQTPVEITKANFEIGPMNRLLFVGSCFADNVGRRFVENQFRAEANPYGVMYNPASVMHTVAHWCQEQKKCSKEVQDLRVVMTLGTNHVYIERATGEIVDNCQKRPQALFEERELSVAECADYLWQAVEMLRGLCTDVKVIVTVSPIRYAKYGMHGSQLSKATLQLAANELIKRCDDGGIAYFPAYEIMNDELRDYRFYEPDMLHPTSQAVDYICQRFKDMFFSGEARQFENEWQPISRALKHRPFNPDSEEYKKFIAQAHIDEKEFVRKWKLDT